MALPTSGTGRRRPGSPRWVRGEPRRCPGAGPLGAASPAPAVSSGLLGWLRPCVREPRGAPLPPPARRRGAALPPRGGARTAAAGSPHRAGPSLARVRPDGCPLRRGWCGNALRRGRTSAAAVVSACNLTGCSLLSLVKSCRSALFLGRESVKLLGLARSPGYIYGSSRVGAAFDMFRFLYHCRCGDRCLSAGSEDVN